MFNIALPGILGLDSESGIQDDNHLDWPDLFRSIPQPEDGIHILPVREPHPKANDQFPRDPYPPKAPPPLSS